MKLFRKESNKKSTYKGFQKINEEDMLNISAGTGIGSTISAITGAVTSGISGIVNVADDISDTIIKNKIVSKIDDVEKGEVELGKDGQIRLKWDNLSTSKTTTPSIIF